MTAAGSGDLDKTRQDIQQTRAELGETVAALATKTDVKTRLRTTATTAAGGLLQRLTQAGQSAKTTTTQLARTVSHKVSQRIKPVTQKAQKATTAVRGAAKAGAQTTSQAESTLVTTARATATKIGSSVRGKPLPVLAVAGTAATLAVVVYRRQRR